jgi:hypothetical protein
MRKAIKKKENKNHKMKEETDDFHHFVFLNGQILLPTNYGLFFFLSLKRFVFSIFREKVYINYWRAALHFIP